MFSKITSGFASNKDGSNASQKEPEKEQSLTTILSTHEDRANLLLLVASCSDAMRQGIVDAFDPEETGGKEIDKALPSSTLEDDEEAETPKDEIALKSLDDEPENDLENAAQAARDEAQAQQQAEERAKKEYARRVKELSGTAMQELKAAALDHFDSWRAHVLERIGGAVNEQPDDTEGRRRAETAIDQVDKTDAGPEVEEHHEVNEALHDLYPPHDTPLLKLGTPKRLLILHSMLLLLLGMESYPAESRVLLLYITSSLSLPLEALTEDEISVAKGLLESAKDQMNADEETKKKVESNVISRRWKVGLGAVAGAALIGVTGGLAAPLLAAGIGSVMGGLGLGATAAAGYLGALAGSAPLIGVLFGAYGGRMTGQMVDSYAKEVEDFAFVPLRKPSKFLGGTSERDLRRLRVAIGVSGWLTEENDITRPWNVVGTSIEAFALRWELEALIKLGNALTTYIKSAAWGLAKSEIIKRTLFAALMAATWPLQIAKASRMIDNPFSVAKVRADKAGKVLADALINKVQGERPVTLIGYSMGARVVYSCLDELAKRKAFGLVESVVLAGAPAPSDSVNWRRIRTVVSGRVVNVFSTNDYLLAFLYRTSSMQLGVAGLQTVQGVKGVENIDVSEIVDGHTQYRYLTGQVLKRIGFEDVNQDEVEKQVKQLQRQVKEDEAERKKHQGETADTDAEVEQMEQEVERKNQTAKAMDWLNKKMNAVRVATVGEKTASSAKGPAMFDANEDEEESSKTAAIKSSNAKRDAASQTH